MYCSLIPGGTASCITLNLGCSYHRHSGHHFLSAWGAVLLEKKKEWNIHSLSLALTLIVTLSPYHFTMSNFVLGQLSNYLYFLWKITALWPSIQIFEVDLSSFTKRFWTNIQKLALLAEVYKEYYSILCSSHILSTAWKLPLTWPRCLC